MFGPDAYRGGYAQTVDTLNKLAGLNKKDIADWLEEIPIQGNGETKPSREFIEKVAGLVIVAPFPISGAIVEEYYNQCWLGHNPQTSETFRKRMVTQAIPAMVAMLQEKASDLSLRASGARHREDTGTKKGGI